MKIRLYKRNDEPNDWEWDDLYFVRGSNVWKSRNCVFSVFHDLSVVQSVAIISRCVHGSHWSEQLNFAQRRKIGQRAKQIAAKLNTSQLKIALLEDLEDFFPQRPENLCHGSYWSLCWTWRVKSRGVGKLPPVSPATYGRQRSALPSATPSFSMNLIGLLLVMGSLGVRSSTLRQPNSQTGLCLGSNAGQSRLLVSPSLRTHESLVGRSWLDMTG